MRIEYTSQELHAEAKTGKKKYWKVLIVTEDEKIFSIQKQFWQEGSVVQTSACKECQPKNVGKKNETSSKQQAYLEVESLINKQKDKGYVEKGEVSTKDPLPMLAYEFSAKKHKMNYPAAGQPKFDGARAMNTGYYYYTRLNKRYIPEITEHIKIDTKGYILDGELLIPGADFETTISAIKKYSEKSKELKYYVYDIIIPDKTFNERWKILEKIFKQKGIKNAELSSLFTIKNEKDVEVYHKKCVNDGFEGLMIRNLDSKYNVGHRSNDLLKRKDFITEEFEIIDVKEGEGNWKGAGTFICKDKNNKVFEAKPDGSIEQAKEYFSNKTEYIGKMVTVKFQNLTKRGVPRFPVAISIRDYE